MMQEMRLSPRPEMVLSPETPVYDALNLGPFHKKIMFEMAQRPNAHMTLFVLGPVSAGKELITKNIYWRQLNDEGIRRIINPYEQSEGRGISYGLTSTPMANWLGREEGSIVSTIGRFEYDEVAASNEIVDATLVNRYSLAPKPALDIVEGGFFGYPYWPFTGAVIGEACERARSDPNYLVRAVVLVPDRKLQQHGMEVREIIDKIGSDSSLQDTNVRRRHHSARGVIFDVSLDRQDIWKGSWGNIETVHQHNKSGDEHALREKEAIRRAANGRLPDYNMDDLLQDDELWARVHMQRLDMVLQDDFGMSPADFIVRRNRKLDVDIPFPRGFGNEIALINAPWTKAESDPDFANLYL
jgi:hypothetical protein